MGKLITSFIPEDQRDTPLGRIAIRARRIAEVVAGRINEGRAKGQQIECPTIPTASDFYELLDLDIQIELLIAQIEIAGIYSSSDKFVMGHRLSQLEWKRAKRDMPDAP